MVYAQQSQNLMMTSFALVKFAQGTPPPWTPLLFRKLKAQQSRKLELDCGVYHATAPCIIENGVCNVDSVLFVYIYISIYMYVCIYIYMYTHVFELLFVYIHMYMEPPHTPELPRGVRLLYEGSMSTFEHFGLKAKTNHKNTSFLVCSLMTVAFRLALEAPPAQVFKSSNSERCYGWPRDCFDILVAALCLCLLL